MTTNPSRRGVLATVVAGAFALAASAIGIAPAAAQDKAPVRVAMGDIASVESLGLLIAMERAKERGVPMELTFFNSEDVATQAVEGPYNAVAAGSIEEADVLLDAVAADVSLVTADDPRG